MRTFAVLSLILALTLHAQAAFTTVGTYDPAADANDVDQSATFVSGTGGASALNVLDLATFKGLVNTAFGANLGGVIDFESGNLENTSGGTDDDGGRNIRSFYGTSGLKTLIISSNDDNDDYDYVGATSNGRVPTSGTTSLGKDMGNSDWNFVIGPITGGLPGEGVVAFGFTLLDRTGTDLGTINSTALFSDGSTVTITANMVDDSSPSNQDSFFGFLAPAGTTIVSISTPVPIFTSADDVAYITASVIPEPSTWVMLLGGGALLVWKRKRRTV